MKGEEITKGKNELFSKLVEIWFIEWQVTSLWMISCLSYVTRDLWECERNQQEFWPKGNIFQYKFIN